ncbi:MAG: hypothetical protein PWR24_1747 [Desulfonauticus sp.]|jgi:cell division protein FtsL|nr:MAG: Uncharacterized protein XD41_1201 [Desulfonauticus sp. 38_4375]MDK2922190.1 hypothetical protein [Desulfonauticus sp.]
MKKESWFLIILIFSGLLLGFFKIWLSISIADLAYQSSKLEKKVLVAQEKQAKLLAEKEYLLSPLRLKEEAEKLGLRPPQEKEVRVLAK